MSFIAGLLTFVLVINCVLLIFLVLVQLPKKDAGAGMAFGAGTADALFGAGGGNALTNITKYATIAFLALALLVGYLQANTHSKSDAAAFAAQVQEKQKLAPALAPQTAPQPAANLLTTPVTSTNAAK